MHKPTPATADFQPGRAWATALLLFVFIIVNFADKVVLGLVAVPMMEDLKITPTQFGLIGSSFFWLFAVTGIAGGVLADRVATRWLLLGMALAWSLMQLPMIFGSTVFAFVAARVLLGMGEGPAWPVALHAVYKWFPDRKRNLPVALLSQGGALGLLIAGVTIPLFTVRHGWRAAFIGLAAIGLLWALAWLLLGREGPLLPQQDKPTDTGRKVPLAEVLRDPTVLGNFVMHFVAYWAMAGALTWLPAYFQKGLGFDGVQSGRLYGLVVAVTIPLVVIASGWSQALLVRGYSSRAARGRFAALSLLLAGLIFLPLSLPGLSVAVRMAIFAFGLGLGPIIYALGPAMLAQVAPPSRRGAVLAIDNSVASFAGILAPFVSGELIARYPGSYGFELGFMLTGVLLLIGAVIGWATVNPERSSERLS